MPNKSKTLIKYIFSYLSTKTVVLSSFLLVTFFWAIENFLGPYLLKVIIDTINTSPTDKTTLIQSLKIPCALYILLAFLSNLNLRLYDFLSMKLYPRLKAQITNDMYSHLIKHSLSFFQNQCSGNLTSKISDMTINVETMLRLIMEAFLPVIGTVLISTLMLMVLVHWILGLIIFIWAILFVILSYYIINKLTDPSQDLAEVRAEISGRISETISAITSIKMFNICEFEINALKTKLVSVSAKDTNLYQHNLRINFVQGIAVLVLKILLMVALIYGYINNKVTIGDFALVLSLSISIVNSIYNIGRQLQQFATMYGTCQQALNIIHIQHDIVDANDAKDIEFKQGKIQFQNVYFSYSPKSTLFDKLDVTLYAKQKIGLVGYSGSGKSTFLKLLLRIIEPKSGSILIDNQNINSITISSLIENITVIPQMPELFNRSIEDNIKLAKPEANYKEVVKAARNAFCDEFINQLPEGYKTIIGERGLKLSGGQIQRIAIARAFLKNAPIILLDEPTSALDSATEQKIQTSLQRLTQDKTTVIIAHRLSTLKNLERVLVFENGQIIEDGSFINLSKKKNGVLSKLWNLQIQTI